MKAMLIDNIPNVLLFATKSINVGTELRYDYGTGSSVLVWRKVKQFVVILYLKIL